MFLLGLDVGTTGAKAIIFDETGKQCGYGFCEYGIDYSKEGFAEQDPESIWEIAKQVVKQAASEAGGKIHALSLSVQGDAVLPIDRNRCAIGPAQLGMDYRGTEEVTFCLEKMGAEHLFALTGMRPHPMNSIIKVFWVKNHQPELFERAWKFVTWSDYILAKLGSDDIVIDYTQASRTMAFDLKEKKWSKLILDTIGIPEEKLAVPVPSGTAVGKINRKLAEELGIEPGTILVTGGHDQTCASLGAGIIDAGLALDSHGTAEVISSLISEPKLDEKMFGFFYPCYFSLLSDRYFTFSLNHTAGLLLKWFSEGFCIGDYDCAREEQKSIYSYLFEKMPSEPSSVMFMPYLNGTGTPTCDLTQKGSILGLTMKTTRFDVAKAIIESLSFESRMNLECLKENGIEISALRCVGGGAKTPAGLQNKADILGIPIHSLKIGEAACLGAAIRAGLTVGEFTDPKEAAALVQLKDTYEPDLARHQIYSEKYEIYKGLYDVLKLTNIRL